MERLALYALIHAWAVEHGLHNRDEAHTGPNDGQLAHTDLEELTGRVWRLSHPTPPSA